MSILEALVLGIVQGLTEFLPISSSAHLVLVPELLGWEEPKVAYLVLLHAATLVALFIYFAKEFIEALDGLDRAGPQRRFIVLLVIGTIPAAVLGVIFEKQFEESFGHPVGVAIQLAVTGILLAAVEVFSRMKKRDEGIEQTEFSTVEKISIEVSGFNALAVGFAQAISIIPGISRSGATISAGLLTGLSRPQAARFSFMLSVPILLGTSIAKIPEISVAEIGVAPLVVGFMASLVSGYLAIAGMIGYLQKRGLFPFATYCLVVGPLVAFFLSR